MRAHPAGKLGEGATAVSGAELCERPFQSTPPARGATKMLHSHVLFPLISIHAPREGGDVLTVGVHAPSIQFQSTPPARGATQVDSGLKYLYAFQSTPPARGATSQPNQPHSSSTISIHAPREGGDPDSRSMKLLRGISIHAPREGGDSKDAQFYLRIFDK